MHRPLLCWKPAPMFECCEWATRHLLHACGLSGKCAGVSFTAGMQCQAARHDFVEALVSHVLLAAFSINAEPGIEAAVEAVVAYREWLEDRVSPAMSFKESPCWVW